MFLCFVFCSSHSCLKGWLKAHLFKPLPGKVDNVSSRHLLEIIKEQEQMIVSFLFSHLKAGALSLRLFYTTSNLWSN